ncbi:hypothetical protein DFH07DRAFT_840383 [Mycena maculata]|uniref:Uncharacterized protein n=1 Tax=Mycena maculata TaxID=230809 RepID=A0AAD7IBD5_9AGAR|nr:hypothetical protein DFH07DRAFT_840383 [Mycena maculata]
MARTSEAEAKGLIEAIIAINKGQLDEASYNWQSINYKQVSSETCAIIASLIQRPPNRGYLPVSPETPHRVRIAREVDFVVAGRQRRVKQRVFDAQNLDDQIKANIEVISRFLRVARRDEREEFTFPDCPGPDKLLGSLQAVRRALNGVETIVRGQQDLEETESDTDDEGDKTVV